MNLKTIKQSNSKTPQIKILDRKTENYGRTLYQVCWINDSKKISWEPIINLKQFYNQIRQYQRNYEERVVNWQIGSTKMPNVGQQNEMKMIEQSREKEANQQNGNQKIIQINSSVQQEQAQKVEFKNNMQREEDIETADKQNIIQPKQANFYYQKIKKPTANEEKDQNIEIARLLIKHSPNVNKKRKYIKIPKPTDQNHQVGNEQPKIQSIKEIFAVEKVWYALVVTQGNVVTKVLRDYLRIEYPLLLLAYYEKVYEAKLKDFSTIL